MLIFEPIKSILFLSAVLIPIMAHSQEPPGPAVLGLETVTEVEIKGVGLLEVGSKVSHAKFGVGVIKAITLSDDLTAINIEFESYGSKWLVAEYANLTLIAE